MEALRTYPNATACLARGACDTEMEDLALLVSAKVAFADVQDFIERYDKLKSGTKDMLCDEYVGPFGSFLLDAVIKLGRLCPLIGGTPDG